MDTLMPPQAPSFDPGMLPMPSPDEVSKLLNEMLDAFESDAEDRLKPRYPAWLDVDAVSKKPDPTVLKTEAKRIWDDFAALRSTFSENVNFLSPSRISYFSDASPDERANAFHDSTPELEVELLVAQMAGIDPTFLPTCRTHDEVLTTADKADFLYACMDDAERRHVATGHGDFKTEAVRTEAIYGRLAAMVLYNTDADYDEMPVVTTLLDPATCAPVYDTHGMAKMVRTYRTTIFEACSAFGVEDRVRRRILNPEGKGKRQEHHDCEVTEFWDRWWRTVWIDSELVLGPVEHKLGYPPFVYQMGSLGLPAYIREISKYAPTTLTHETLSWKNPVANPHRGVSHISLLREPIKLREAIQTRLLTAFRREIDPPMVVEQNIISADKGVPEISRDPNAMNPIEMGNESVNVLPVAPNAASLGPLMNQVNEILGRVTFPASAYGINSNSNVSGFAVENLAENGRDKLLPHLVTLEAFYRQIAEMQLRLFRDWGWVLRQGEGERGRFAVPRHRVEANIAPMFELKPDALRDSGTHVKVKMTSIRLSNLGQVANALAILNNMGLLRKRWAFEVLGEPNPDRAVLELQQEQGPVQAQAMPHPAIGAEAGPVGIQGASLPGFGMAPGPGSGPQGPRNPMNPLE